MVTFTRLGDLHITFDAANGKGLLKDRINLKPDLRHPQPCVH